ncbi:MAG: protein-L-isoaspartate O-methyltransferase [Theionarchaea archaeon]|nr:protein-L-isoaspartate O-methyltransferase [Theionarchaea archaeon]
MWQWQWKSLRPHKPKKSREKLEAERMKKIQSYIDEGILKTPELIEVFKRVPREEFVPYDYRDYTYREAPLPLPALEGTISCPHSYPLFYEAMGLKSGDYFLEVGTGSGYGAALARDIVGKEGRVISLEIDRSAYDFAKSNLTRLGYNDIVLIRGDGYLGYEPEAPYDKISITAAVPSMPETFLDQLKDDGLAVAPIGPIENQRLMLIRKDGSMEMISESAVFVPMVGRYRHGR